MAKKHLRSHNVRGDFGPATRSCWMTQQEKEFLPAEAQQYRGNLQPCVTMSTKERAVRLTLAEAGWVCIGPLL